MKYELIDTHAHLDMDRYDGDRSDLIRKTKEASVGFINMGLDLPTSHRSLKMAKNNSNVFAAAGFHPHEADKLDASALGELAELCRDGTVKAVGEIGLDYYRENSPRDAQKRAFRAQLDLAAERNLPVSIHNRDSTDDLLDILKEKKPSSGVIHSFFGDEELGREFIQLGLYLGLSGPLTFAGEEELRATVGELPLEKLVLETDSPFLTPEPHRGKRNEPLYVEFVARQVAEIKDLPVEEVNETTAENARRLFNLNEH